MSEAAPESRVGTQFGPYRVISLPHTLAGGNGVACEHALRAVCNVVLDVNVCAPQNTNQASMIASDMAAKVPR